MAAENGVGLTVLPQALGDMSDKLCRVGTTLPGVKTGLWILTHADLLRSARIHALIEHFSDALCSTRWGRSSIDEAKHG